MEKFKHIAVLIDAENAKLDCIGPAINEIEKCGQILLKEAYGDWSKPHLKNWTTVCKTLNIERVMQSGDIKGKNSTDIALVIGAMDCLYKNKFDALALVSSDSDYTPLILRLHKDAVSIIVVGKKDASKALKKRCDKFISEEDLLKISKNTKDNSNKKPIEDAHRLIHEVYKKKKAETENEWIPISMIGEYAKIQYPKFSIKSTGNAQWIKFLKKFEKKYYVEYKNSPKKAVVFKCK